jgi:hypothetical protein
MNLIEEYFNLRWLRLFFLVVLSYLLTIWLSQSLVNEIVYYNTYSEQLTYDRAMELYAILKKHSWVSFVCFPLILLIKITTITLILYTGVIFFNLQKQLSLVKVLRVVTGAEMIFVIAGIIKVLWFNFFAGNYTLTDISFFYPVSLINLFNPRNIDQLWVFPLQTINLFHFAYLLLLAYGIKIVGNISNTSSEKIVLSTYLPALTIWIALIMFLLLSPKS